MAIVYYPTSASVYIRQATLEGLTEQVIGVEPDIIFVFSGSTGFTSSFAATSASWASRSLSASWAPAQASDFSISASWSSASFSSSFARSASHAYRAFGADSAIAAATAEDANFANSASISTFSHYATSASWASQSLSASWAPGSPSNVAVSSSWASQSLSSSYPWTPDGSNIAFVGGNVGIGTTNPLAKLHISESIGTTIISDTSAGYNYLQLKSVGSTNGAGIVESYDRLDLYSNNIPAVSIDNNNVGIGTISPVNKLDVIGNISCSVITASLFGSASYSDTASVASDIATNYKRENITLGIDGSGEVITTGNKGFSRINYSGTIKDWAITSDQSGSIAIDVWKKSNDIPTVANSIVSLYKPSLVNNRYYVSSSLPATFTSSFVAGDVFGFNVDSATTVTRINLVLGTEKI